MPLMLLVSNPAGLANALLPAMQSMEDILTENEAFLGCTVAPAGPAGSLAGVIPAHMGTVGLEPTSTSTGLVYGTQDDVAVVRRPLGGSVVHRHRMTGGVPASVTGFTVGARIWFPASMAAAGILFSDVNNFGLRIDHNSGNFRTFLQGSGGASGSYLNCTWPGAGWHTILVSFDNAEMIMRVEIDGVVTQGTLTASLATPAGAWGWGSFSLAGDAEFALAREIRFSAGVYGSEAYAAAKAWLG